MDGKILSFLNESTLHLTRVSEKFSTLIEQDVANRWIDEGRGLADKIVQICRFQKKLYGIEKARFDAHLHHLNELEKDLSETKLSDAWKEVVLLHLKIVLQQAQHELRAAEHPNLPKAFPPFSSIRFDAGKYALLVGLPQQTFDALVVGEIRFFGMAETARVDKQLAIERFKELDAYGSEEEGEEQQDEEVVLEGPQDLNYLFDPIEKGGLNADGLFLTIHRFHRSGHGEGLSLQLQGTNSGYALLHPVAPMYNSRCTPFYKEARKRANWEGIRAYLSTILGRRVQLNHLYHHFDYAIIPRVSERVVIKEETKREHEKERDRKKGLGRLVLRASLDKVLPPEAIAIGFIDPDPSHCDSLIAAAKAGCFIGREVNPAFDGPHPAFLELFCKTWQWDFTNVPVLSQRTGQPYDHHKEGKEGLPEALRAAFTSYPHSLIGFCRERNRFEIATARKTL